MKRYARHHLDDDGVRQLLHAANVRGASLVSLVSSGDRDSGRHAVVVEEGAGRPQRFLSAVEASRVEPLALAQAREGYEPMLLGVYGGSERPLCALVFERVERPASRVVAPRPFREPGAATFLEALAAMPGTDASVVTWIAATGVPADDRGEGLVVAAILRPQPRPRIAWAVHFDRVREIGWRASEETRRLETLATPVLALPIERADGARFVLSLWHDTMTAPWPEPDPFAHREGVACEDEGRAEPLERSWSVVDADEGAGDPPREHLLDRWMREHMESTGARHAQLVVARGASLAFARAYTYAEQGYPAATLGDAMRLGSVSKALTAMALLPSLRRLPLDAGVDTRITDSRLLDLDAPSCSARVRRLTLRHLLTHDAGLRTFTRIEHDEPENLLSQARIVASLGGASAVGSVARALVAAGDAAFATEPGAGAQKGYDYSNEAYLMLGEILARIACGRTDAYEEAIRETLLRPAGVDQGDRGVVLASGPAHARARGESPAHASSPTWALDRFSRAQAGERSLVPRPYIDDGAFLAAAAGWCTPLVVVAKVLAALGPRDRSLWTRADADIASAPVPWAKGLGHGFFLAPPAWWTTRSPGALTSLSVPVTRLHHNGRMEGGASLLVHQFPKDPKDDGRVPTLSFVLATNQLGPLHYDPHGQQLLDLAKQIELANAWSADDLFPRVMHILCIGARTDCAAPR